MSDTPPDLPAVPQALDAQLKRLLSSMREHIRSFRGFTGDGSGAALTREEAEAIIGSGSIGPAGPPGPPGPTTPYVPDLTPPPTPTGVTVVAGLTFIHIETDAPVFTEGHGYDRTVVYAAKWPSGAAPTFSSAVEVHSFIGPVGSFTSDTGTRWAVWLKWRTNDAQESTSPEGGAGGHVVTTGKVGNADLGPLAVQAANLAAGAVDLSSGKVTNSGNFGAIAVGYTVTEYLLTTSGIMGNLVVTSAQVQSLAASKITAGSIGVGDYIQSTGFVSGSVGWRIAGNGTPEFNNIVARGAIFASSGAIGGSLIGSTYMMSTTWVTGSTGWRLNSDGTGQIGGITIGSDYISSAAYSAGVNGFRFKADGTGQIGGILFTTTAVQSANFVTGVSGFQIKQDGTVEFQGALVRGNVEATSLNVTSVNIVKTLHIDGNAVSVPMFMAMGNASYTPAGTYPLTAVELFGQKQVILFKVQVASSGSFGVELWRDSTKLVSYPSFFVSGGGFSPDGYSIQRSLEIYSDDPPYTPGVPTVYKVVVTGSGFYDLPIAFVPEYGLRLSVSGAKK